MSDYFRIIENDEKKPIYLVVPGFIGNYTEGLIKDLYNYLKKNGASYAGITFRGYGENDDDSELAIPDEMIKIVIKEYSHLRQIHPIRRVIVLAHSQGCAIAIKASAQFDRNTSLILLAPAIFLDSIILSRISPPDLAAIEAGKTLHRKASLTKTRTIDRNFVNAYRQFSIKAEVSAVTNHCLIIRPKDDYIDQSNAEFLRQNLTDCAFEEIIGDHTFFHPKEALENLLDRLFE